MRLNHDQKEQCLAGMRLLGTKKAGALAANISIEKLNEEIKKSAVFKKRANEALSIGKPNLGETGLEVIVDYALGKCAFCHGSKMIQDEVCSFCNGTGIGGKTDRNRLTAAIALANAFIPGFKGVDKREVSGQIDFLVKTAVPRPNYQIIEPEKKLLDKPSSNMLKSGKRTKKVIVDQEGNYIGTQTVEDVIEGEVINEQTDRD